MARAQPHRASGQPQRRQRWLPTRTCSRATRRAARRRLRVLSSKPRLHKAAHTDTQTYTRERGGGGGGGGHHSVGGGIKTYRVCVLSFQQLFVQVASHLPLPPGLVPHTLQDAQPHTLRPKLCPQCRVAGFFQGDNFAIHRRDANLLVDRPDCAQAHVSASNTRGPHSAERARLSGPQPRGCTRATHGRCAEGNAQEGTRAAWWGCARGGTFVAQAAGGRRQQGLC